MDIQHYPLMALGSSFTEPGISLGMQKRFQPLSAHFLCKSHQRVYNNSFFLPPDCFSFGNQSNQNLNTKPRNVALLCRTGHSLQFIVKEIRSKREYNLLQKAQHLLALYMMRLGETSQMGGWVRYPYVLVSMYPCFYISISDCSWPVF